MDGRSVGIPTKRRHWLRASIAAALVMGALLPAASPVRAVLALDVNPDSGFRGATLTATASGFEPPPGEVTFWWDTTTLLGVDPTIVGGTASLKFQIPSDASFGTHVVRACHGSACIPGRFVEATVTVVRRPRATPTPPPPTPKPTRRPTPPSATPGVTPGPTGAAIPVPSFPLAGPTAPPTPLPFVAVTPAPPPPNDVATSPGPFPDLDVLAMEVTQGIQDLNNNMPLVADRRTYVRVHLDVIGQNELAHTYGALEGRRNGAQIGWIWPENGPITAVANGGNRLDLDDSLYFRLPASWLHGSVTLNAFVYSHNIATPWTKEPESENNFEEETVVFHEGDPLDLHLVPLHLHRSFHPSDLVREYTVNFGQLGLATESTIDASRIVAGLWRYHPISAMSVDVIPFPIGPLDHNDDDEWDLGDCATTVLAEDPSYPGLMLSSWEPLMEDPDQEFEEGQYVTPDRDKIWILDRTYEVGYFYVRYGTQAQVFGSNDGLGPAPVPGAPAFVDGCPNPAGESGQPNSTVALLRTFYDWADEREFFVGMVHPLARTRWAGLAGTLDTAWVSMNPNLQDTTWYYRGAGTMAHEVAHLTGLNHVSCADGNDDGVADEIAGGPIDPQHPQAARFPDCSLAEVREHGYYGFDVYFDSFGLAAPTVISNDPNAPEENRAYPLLSYARPRWIDPYHYCRLLVYYGVACDPDSIDEPWISPGGELPGTYGIPPAPLDGPLPDPGVPILLLSGTWDADTGEATLDALLSVDDPTPPILEQLARQGDVPEDLVVARVIARDGGGAVVSETPIAADGPDAESAGEEHSNAFDVLVPLDRRISRLELVQDGEVLAVLDVSPTPPTGRWISPQSAAGQAVEVDASSVVAFEATDADGDPLSVTLLYSPDGEHWQVVATGIDTGYVLGAAVDTLPGSDVGTLRLLISDGIHTTIASGEPIVRVANKAPMTRIVTPVVELRVPLGHEVVVEGSVFDREERRLDDTTLRWSSSLDGPLGTGRELRTDGLSAGRHTITLEATDAEGMQATSSIEIVVDGSVVEAAPDDETIADVDRIFSALAAGIDPAPSDDAHPDFIWIPFGVAALVAMAAIGGLFYLRRARLRATGVGLLPRAAEGAHAPPSSPPPADLAAHEAAHVSQESSAYEPSGPSYHDSWDDSTVDQPDDSSTWMPTSQLATGGSMDPQPGGGGLNELSMHDSPGKEAGTGGGQTTTVDVDETITVSGGSTEGGVGDAVLDDIQVEKEVDSSAPPGPGTVLEDVEVEKEVDSSAPPGPGTVLEDVEVEKEVD